MASSRSPGYRLALACLMITALSSRMGRSQVTAEDLEMDIIEALSDDDSDAGTVADMESLLQLLVSPLDINRASSADLETIPGFRPEVAARIVRRRSEKGDFASLDELTRVPGIRADVLAAARPYITLSPPKPGTNASRLRIIQFAERRLDTGIGYSRPDSHLTRYTGSPYRVNTKVAFTAGDNVTAGLTLEKDPGEPMDWSLQKRSTGFDFASASFAYSGEHIVRRIIVGDYRFGTALGIGIGSSGFHSRSLPTRSPASIPRAYTGSGESGFLRGAAITLQPSSALSLTALVSRRRLDARDVGTDSTSPGSGQVLLISPTGLHRTPTETANRNLVGETVAGGRIAASVGPGTASVTGAILRFSRPIARGTTDDQQFDFTGTGQTILSVDLAIVTDRLRCVAEVAATNWTAANAAAVCQGHLSQAVRAWFHVRSYSRSGYSLLGAAMSSRGGRPRAETGLLAGTRWRFATASHVTVYLHQSHARWLRHGVYLPTDATEMALVSQSRHRGTDLRLRLTAKSTDQPDEALDAAGRQVRVLKRIETVRISGRARIDLRKAYRLTIRGAFSTISTANAPPTSGQMISVEPSADLAPGVTVSGGVAVFDSETHDARLYAYEQGPAYRFGVRSYSGRGERSWLLITARFSRRTQIEVKYAMTRSAGSLTMGSGLDEVDGDRIRDVSVQVTVDL